MDLLRELRTLKGRKYSSGFNGVLGFHNYRHLEAIRCGEFTANEILNDMLNGGVKEEFIRNSLYYFKKLLKD